MSVPMSFFNSLDQAGTQTLRSVERALTEEYDEQDVDLHENADMTADDVTAALLAGGAADAHVEIEEWN